MRDWNDDQANKSRKNHIDNQSSVPLQSLKETFAEGRRENAQDKFRNGVKLNMAPQTESSRGDRSNVPAYGTPHNNYRNPDRRNLRSMHGENPDQHVDDEQQAWDDRRNQRGENDHYFNYAGNGANTDANTEGCGSLDFLGPQGREETNKPPNVCWDKFNTGSCSKPDCNFIHSESELRAYGVRKIKEHEKTMKSPYVMTRNPMQSRGNSQSKPSGGSSTLSSYPEKKLWISDVDRPTADIRDDHGRPKIDEIPSPTHNNPM
jgi:hypothetical protein